jgi:hypothetical protein
LTVIAGTDTGTPADGGLARRVHLGSGLNDIAHDGRPDLAGMKPGACDGGLDRDGAEFGRWYVLQAAAKGADRGSHRGDQNNRTR